MLYLLLGKEFAVQVVVFLAQVQDTAALGEAAAEVLACLFLSGIGTESAGTGAEIPDLLLEAAVCLGETLSRLFV